MKGKRHKKYALRRIIPVKAAALSMLMCVCVLCGCSKIGSSDSSSLPQATAPAQQETEGSSADTSSEPLPETTTTSAESKKTGKTSKATKPSDKKTESGTTTTKKTTPAGTESQTTAPQVTYNYTEQQTQQTEPVNASVTSKVTTSSSAKDTSGKPQTAARERDEKPQAEYHIYADGYVTKYDELKLRNLTKDQRRAYNSLSEGIWKMQKDIPIPEKVIKQSEAADFLYTVLGTMPEVNYVTGTFKMSVGGGYVTKYTIDYSLDTKQAQEQHKALRAAASRIIGSLPSGMTDSEKVRYFHDYIIKNCEYSKEGGNSSYTAYGCLVEGKAVCEGYAMALDYLCEKAGIYSLLISGESTSSSGQKLTHIWNKIQLDNKWYNFDVTWDDPVSSFGPDYVRYDYYAVPDKQLERTHTTDKNRFGYYPEAWASDENYFVKNGLYIDSTDEADEMVTDALALSLTEGQVCASVRCSKSTFDDVYKLIMSSDEQTGLHTVSRYLAAACEKSGIYKEYAGFYAVKNDGAGVIAIILK